MGKSCILHRLISNEFKDDYEVTIGAEFSSVIAKIQEKTIKLQVWDTAGQENFRSMIRVFYKGSHAAFLVYDITRKETFDKLEDWVGDIRENALPEVKIILLGNRKDEEDNRQVTTDAAKEFCTKFDLSGFYETSAKSGEGVREVFAEMAKILYLNAGSNQEPGTQSTKSAPIKIDAQKAKKDGCC